MTTLNNLLNSNDNPILEKNTPSFSLPSDHNLIMHSIKFWVLRARAKYHLTPKQFPMPVVSYDLAGNTMGLAKTIFPCASNGNKWEQTIKLNPMYADHNSYQMRNEVIPHEVCHLVVHILNPWKTIKPHGQEWHNVCNDLGFFHAKAVYNAPNYKDVSTMVVIDMLKNMSEDDF